MGLTFSAFSDIIDAILMIVLYGLIINTYKEKERCQTHKTER
jgi:hypothetical protein